MAPGRRAFPGLTRAIINDAILNRLPDLPSRVNSRVPPELQAIILHALQKSRSARYQNAVQMRLDLTRLKRRLDSGRIAGFDINANSVRNIMMRRSTVFAAAALAVF